MLRVRALVFVTALGNTCAKRKQNPYLYRRTSKAKTTTRSWSNVRSSKGDRMCGLLAHKRIGDEKTESGDSALD
jgi:hypothetical protein